MGLLTQWSSNIIFETTKGDFDYIVDPANAEKIEGEQRNDSTHNSPNIEVVSAHPSKKDAEEQGGCFAFIACGCYIVCHNGIPSYF